MRDALQQLIAEIPGWLWLLLIWDCVWKLIAFWKAAKNNHPIWYIVIAVTSTFGIIPIIYVLTHWSKQPQHK